MRLWEEYGKEWGKVNIFLDGDSCYISLERKEERLKKIEKENQIKVKEIETGMRERRRR